MPLSRLQHSHTSSKSSDTHKPTSSTDHREAPAGGLSTSTVSPTIVNSMYSSSPSSSSTASSTSNPGAYSHIPAIPPPPLPNASTDSYRNRPRSEKSQQQQHLGRNLNQSYDTSPNTKSPLMAQTNSYTTSSTTTTTTPPPPNQSSLSSHSQGLAHSSTTSLSPPSVGVISSDYALRIVFEQFEKLADKKMSLVLNTGVVRTQNS